MAEVAASVEIVPSKGDPEGTRMKEYEAMYQYSITRPEEFWAKVNDDTTSPCCCPLWDALGRFGW